jgi:protein-S-isoprenylcysteine O-methyltransferase Ste14
MGLNLSNPKTFLPLLLFIGFVFALFGKGWESLSYDSGMYSTGLLIIGLAILLWIISQIKR